jgi:glyceraldehyde 3-phosphate dehydrogenase (phosphorylating)
MLGALLEFDSNYGLWERPVSATQDSITAGDGRIAFLDVSSGVPDWSELGVEVVVDCSGRAVVRDGAQAHPDRGAQRVLVSAPSRSLDDCDAVLLRGIPFAPAASSSATRLSAAR